MKPIFVVHRGTFAINYTRDEEEFNEIQVNDENSLDDNILSTFFRHGLKLGHKILPVT